MNKRYAKATVLLAVAIGIPAIPVAASAGSSLDVQVVVDPGDAGSGLKALTIQLAYPKDALAIPGVGGAAEVKDRVQLLLQDPGKDDLLMVNDDDATATLRVVYIRQPLADDQPIPKGAVVAVRFDRSAEVDPARVGCTVVGASDQTGRAIDGVRCTVQAGKS